MKKAGVHVGLSTDSAPSIRAELGVARRANLEIHGTHLTARQLLGFATMGSARCLGRQGEIGEIAIGAAADFAIWPLPESAAGKKPDEVLEEWLSAGPAAPRFTIINGQVVVENGQLVSPLFADRKRRHDNITAEWQKFVDAK